MSNSSSAPAHPLTSCYDSLLAVRLFLCNRVGGEQAPFECADISLTTIEKKLSYAFEAFLYKIQPTQSSFYLHNIIAQVNYLLLLNYYKHAPSSVHVPGLLPQYKSVLFARRKDIFDQYLTLLVALKKVYNGQAFWDKDISKFSITEIRKFEKSILFQNHKRILEPQFPKGVSRCLQVFKSRILAEAFLNYPQISNEKHALQIRQAQYNVDKYTCRLVPSDPIQLNTYLSKLDVMLSAFASRKVSNAIYDARTHCIRTMIGLVDKLSNGVLTVRITGLLAMTIDHDTTPLQLMVMPKDNKMIIDAKFDTLVCKVMQSLLTSSHTSEVVINTKKSTQTVVYGISNHSISFEVYSYDIDMFAKVGLFNNYAQCTPILGQLCRAVLSWADRRALLDNNPSGLSSWSLILMIIQYLQLQDILPVLQKSSALYKQKKIEVKKTEVKTPGSSWSNLFKKPDTTAVESSIPIKEAVITPITSIPRELPKWVKHVPVYKDLAVKTFKSSLVTEKKHNRRVSSTTVFTNQVSDILREPQLTEEDWSVVYNEEQGRVYTMPGLKIGISNIDAILSLSPAEQRKFEAPVKKQCSTALSTLFIGFFMFYTYTFNRELMAVSVRSGHLLWSEQARQVCKKSFCIEDPFHPKKYTTANTSEDAIESLFLECKRTCMLLINQVDAKELTSSYLHSLRILQYIAENRPSDVGYDSYEHSSICNWFVLQEDVDAIKKISQQNEEEQNKKQTKAVFATEEVDKSNTVGKDNLQKRMEKKRVLRDKREAKKIFIAQCIKDRETRYNALLSSKLQEDEKAQQLLALDLENQQDKMLLLSYDVDSEDDLDEDANIQNVSTHSAMDEILATPMIYFHNDSDFEEEEEGEHVQFATFEEMTGQDYYSDEEDADSLHLVTMSPKRAHMIPTRDELQNVQDIVQSLNKALVDVQDDEEDDETMYLSFA